MVHDRRPCPLDGSRLVSGGASFGAKGVDLTDWYCPRCDVAFVLLSPTRSDTPPSVLQWYRRDGQLELREEDSQRWEELPRQFREAWESNVRYHVKLFLNGRSSDSDFTCCQKDGGRIPILYKGQDTAGPWRFAWCSFCHMGFLFTRDDSYGWEHCADVFRTKWLKKYRFGRQYETGSNRTANPRMLEELPPISVQRFGAAGRGS